MYNILSFISPGTPSKKIIRGSVRDRDHGGVDSRLLDSSNAPFRRIKDPSLSLFFSFLLFFFFLSGMKKRVRVGEG